MKLKNAMKLSLNPLYTLGLKSVLGVSVLVLLLGTAGCKSKKKAMEASSQKPAATTQDDALARQREEEMKRREAEEAARRDAEAKRMASYDKLNEYFNAIANASTVTSANSSIQEALTLFSSGSTPVLIVIHESGDQKDYDRPTTISAYLNYLKDQKKSINRVGNLKFDSSGKITEVELVKQ